MIQRERVEILRSHYPGYDAPLDSKAHNPQIYGVTLTAAARELLRGGAKKKAPVYKLTIRLDREREAQLRAALKGKEPADWVRERIEQKIKSAARLREAERQVGYGDPTPDILSETGAAVNGERP